MIFPILQGLLGFRTAPVTWLLVIINCLVFGYTEQMSLGSQKKLEGLLKNTFFLKTQGQVYSRYLLAGSESGLVHSEFAKKLAQQIENGDTGRVELLGQMALRDSSFMEAADVMQLPMDPVALKMWQKKSKELRTAQSYHPSYVLGLSSGDASWTSWVSYIFVHSGGAHLLGNMLFLLIFGAGLERAIGGLGFLCVFLLSGLMGAGVFSLMTGITGSPLVGASGAVSGVMALFCLLHWNKPIRYFYWLFLPFRRYMGFVYLPAWVAIVFWMVSDLGGLMGTLPDLGGVAHAAHLGGELAGLLSGSILFFIRRLRHQEMPRLSDVERKMGVLHPFLPETTRIQLNSRLG